MDSSADPSIDDLADCTTVKDYGDLRIVTIPGCSTLSEPKRTAVFNKAQQRQMAIQHTDSLLSRLRCMTPPLDENEENEESRSLEAQARKKLESEGCPPCYPPYLEIPFRNIPDKYQEIIGYWKSFPGTGDVVLCAQFSDWREFCSFQERVRSRYRNKTFSEFVYEVRERRRRHEVAGDARLVLDLKQQSRLENWMEFQDYHLRRLERFEKKLNELKKELDDSRKKTEDTDSAGAERGPEDAEAVQRDLEHAERDLERQKILLQWIEQKRQAMDTGYPIPVEEENDNQDAAPKLRETSTCGRRERQPDFRVSKAKRKKRNRHTQEPRALKQAQERIDAMDREAEADKHWKRRKRSPVTNSNFSNVTPERINEIKRSWDAQGLSREEQIGLARTLFTPENRVEVARILGIGEYELANADGSADAPGFAGVRVWQPRASLRQPTKDTSHKTRSGRVTKNTAQSQSFVRTGTQSRRTAATPVEATISGHRPKRSKRALNVPDMSGDSTTTPQHQPRSRQYRVYEKERESRRLRGQPPECGMFSEQREVAPLYQTLPKSTISRKPNSSGSRRLAAVHYRRSQQ